MFERSLRVMAALGAAIHVFAAARRGWLASQTSYAACASLTAWPAMTDWEWLHVTETCLRLQRMPGRVEGAWGLTGVTPLRICVLTRLSAWRRQPYVAFRLSTRGSGCRGSEWVRFGQNCWLRLAAPWRL